MTDNFWISYYQNWCIIIVHYHGNGIQKSCSQIFCYHFRKNKNSNIIVISAFLPLYKTKQPKNLKKLIKLVFPALCCTSLIGFKLRREGERLELNDRDTAPSQIAALPPFPARDRDLLTLCHLSDFQTCKMFGYWCMGLFSRNNCNESYMENYHWLSFGAGHIDSHRRFTPASTQYFGGCGDVRRADWIFRRRRRHTKKSGDRRR